MHYLIMKENLSLLLKKNTSLEHINVYHRLKFLKSMDAQLLFVFNYFYPYINF